MFAVQNIVHIINLGEIIYHVSFTVSTYAIHKTRIKEKAIQRHNGFHTGISTRIYRCEDGYTFDTTLIDLPVFQSRSQAVDYIVEQLNADIQLAEVSLRNAQEHLSRLQRTIKVYQKYQINDETE